MDESALQSLPGGDLVIKGLHDLRTGVDSVEALLVQIGATNLRLRGLSVPMSQHPDTPEHRLYARLQEVRVGCTQPPQFTGPPARQL